MKKTFLLPLLFFQIIGFSQIINIPDINFKTKLLSANVDNPIAGYIKIDINNNNQIEQSEALLVTNLNLFNSNISSIEGIQYFTNIMYLGLHFNSLTSVNLNNLTQLVNLKCNANNLATLNLTGLINLEQLDISSNYLNSLDFTGLTSLKILKCDFNQFSVLDFSENNMLSSLYCKNNNLTSINLKNGINHDFSNVNFNDCWKTGNPNLATICVDVSELASVQNHLNNCGTAQTINITSNCGLGSEEFAANKVVLYPNPTSSIITINSNEIIKSIELYDSLGMLLVSKIVANNQYSLNLCNYSNGIYFVKIVTDNGEKIEKILKQ